MAAPGRFSRYGSAALEVGQVNGEIAALEHVAEDRGVVHQVVDAAVGAGHRLDTGLRRGFVAHVGAHEQRLAAGGADARRDAFATFLVQLRHHHFHAACREGIGIALADAAAGARDDRYLAREIHCLLRFHQLSWFQCLRRR